MKQIWNDTDFTLTGTSRPVRITVDGKEIYKGVLNAYPNEDDVNMLINKVCEPFLKMDYPENTGVTSHPEAYRVFRVEDWDGNLLGTQDFIYDWSYEAFRPVLSKPVNGKLDPRMRLPYTMWRSEAGDVEIEVTEGSHWIDPDTCVSECFVDYCADCQEDYCASDFEPEPVSHIYVDEIQVEGDIPYAFSNPVFSIYSVSALTCAISGDYYYVTQSGNEIRFNLTNTSNPAPTGTTGTISITRGGEEYAEIGYRVTSRSTGTINGFDTGNSIPVEEMTFTFTGHPGGSGPFVAPDHGGNNFIHSGFTISDYYNLIEVKIGTLIADGVYMARNLQCLFDYNNNPNDVLTFRKSAKTNAIHIVTNSNYVKTEYSVSLASGYCSITVYNPISKGLTDIYLDNTTWWFNSLPDFDDSSIDNIKKRGKWLSSKNPVTVHCRDGNITWTPNYII